jgi:hypothetical protein
MDLEIPDHIKVHEDPLYMNRYETQHVWDILETLTDEDKLTDSEIDIYKKNCVENCITRMEFYW